ncbi:hypothetical protein EF808_00410 [archaeon]|nr:MAG: hypothetical protein EF808_00410 [archaeon]
MLKKTAFASVLALAFLVRAEPYLVHSSIMGVDAYYHMRIIEDFFIRDALYAGGRTTIYPPLFHLVMHIIPLSVQTLARTVPPLLSTSVICTFAYMLRQRADVAIVGTFMLALHPALIARTYFIPELLAIAVAPLLYAWFVDGRPLRTAVMVVFLSLTHVFSALIYLGTLVTVSGRDRRVRFVAIAALVTLGAFVALQGPRIQYARPSFIVPLFMTIAVYLPFAVLGRPRGLKGRTLLIGTMATVVLSLLLPREVATSRIGAIGALFVCGTASYGLVRAFERDRNAFYAALVLFLALGLSVGLARTPVYTQPDIEAAGHLGGMSASPVMTTAGHLVTYHGASVLIDEYAEFSPHHDKRSEALYGIVLHGSTDYRVPSEAGVRYLHVERSVSFSRELGFSCLYDDGARIYLLTSR